MEIKGLKEAQANFYIFSNSENFSFVLGLYIVSSYIN